MTQNRYVVIHPETPKTDPAPDTRTRREKIEAHRAQGALDLATIRKAVDTLHTEGHAVTIGREVPLFSAIFVEMSLEVAEAFERLTGIKPVEVTDDALGLTNAPVKPQPHGLGPRPVSDITKRNR